MKYIKRFEDIKNREAIFDIGDIVKCIDSSDSHYLQTDKLYTILDIRIALNCVIYKINGAPTNSFYSEDRFIKATDAEIDQNKYNL